MIAACGTLACGPSWRPCVAACTAPLPAAFEADPNARPAVIHLMPSQMWHESGMVVRKGDRLLFTATGEVVWDCDHRSTGPDGENGRPGWRVGRGGFIGKVGVDGKPFDIGARTGLFPAMHARPPYHPSPPPPIRMPRDGSLYVGFKDFMPGANTGSFEVTIQSAARLKASRYVP